MRGPRIFIARDKGLFNHMADILARMSKSHGASRFPTHHGYGEVKVSRYLVLYVAQVFWFALGVYLYWGAFWPSSCTPHNVLDAYACSMMLPENGGWREAALLTWMWATPILVMLEVSRRVGKERD